MCDASGDITPLLSSPSSTTSATSTTPSTTYDPAFYTWSTFFRGITGSASDDEVKKYINARSILHEEEDCKRCERQRDWLFQYSPVVRFMRDSVEKLGADLDHTNVVCRRCNTLSKTGVKQGAFSGDFGILLCANHLKGKKDMEDVLAHEMVHAYDYMRFKYDKWNLKHMACTEIRANTLSGECRWTREFFTRKQYSFTQHFQECVRRRAALAVRTHSGCRDDAHATSVVNEVWKSCFTDTRPFDDIYR